MKFLFRFTFYIVEIRRQVRIHDYCTAYDNLQWHGWPLLGNLPTLLAAAKRSERSILWV